ncbi:MAG: UvrD-helicase domain-containing protein [bacterium]
MAHRIIAEEQALLAQVRQALDTHEESPGPSESTAVAELERLREQLISGRGTDDRAAALLEFNRQEALLRQLRTSRQRARVAADSPYFGHLRLREQGREWDVCLGKATFIERGVSIVDWRNAPVSQLFYRYEQGDEYDEELVGRHRLGSVVARRTVTIRDSTLRRVDAPEGIFRRETAAAEWQEVAREAPRLAGGEGVALRVYRAETTGATGLGVSASGRPTRADKHLPDIAGLIDPEQFELITRPSTGLVVIRGTAGSGKTTVALHRIAYLAYDDAAIDSERTLVVVFSRALRDYVSHVLPALGVHHVRVCAFHEWAGEQRRRHFPMLPRDTADDAPAVVHRLKNHPVALELLAAQVAVHKGAATARQALDDWGSAFGDVERVTAVVERVAPGVFTSAELGRAAEWCGQRYRDLLAFLAREDPTPVEVGSEDEALLLRAWQLRVGPLRDGGNRPLRFRHVAIDEVQDFSPLDVRVLLDCLDEGRSMTLAGDTQQHVLQEAGFTSWSEFFSHLGLSGTEVSTLRVSYRSTHEIVRFALELLGPLREDDTPPETTRSGPPVELFRFTDHGACVGFLANALKHLEAAEPTAAVVLLAPNAEVASMYYEALEKADVPRLSLVRDQQFSFSAGIEVVEIADIKGLEFDYVVLLEASATHYPDTPAARRRLHVGATRAIHQLWLTSVATPSPLLRDASGKVSAES